MEKHADKKPTEIATMGLLYPADCKKSRANFVSNCRPTWVSTRRRRLAPSTILRASCFLSVALG